MTIWWEENNEGKIIHLSLQSRGGRCSLFLTMRLLTMQFLADVFNKTSTSMFLTMFEKTQNLLLTMHISDVFQTIKNKLKNSIRFFKPELQS